MALLMMTNEFPVVPLIPMGMVVLPCNITAVLTIHFSFIMKSMNIFNFIIYIVGYCRVACE